MPIRDSTATSVSGAAAVKRITLPASVQPGDLLLIQWSAAVAPDTPPLGWAEIVTYDGGVSHRIYRKFAAPGDANAQITIPSTSVAKVSLAAVVIANPDSVVPTSGQGGLVETVSSTTHVGPGITSTTTGLVLQFLSLKDGATASSARSISAGYTLLQNQGTGGSNSMIAMIAVSTTDIASGTVPAVTWTSDQASSNAHSVAIAIAPRSNNLAVRTITDITSPAGSTNVGGTSMSAVRGDDDPNTYTLIPVSTTAVVSEMKFGTLSGPLKQVTGKVILDGSNTVTITPALVQGTTVLATFAAQVLTGITEQSYTITLTAPQQAAQTVLGDIRWRESITGA
jgi:hypothetical protein